MTWADRVEQVLRMIDEVVHGRAPEALDTDGASGAPAYAGSTVAGRSPWAS